MALLAKNTDFVKQIDFFDALMQDGMVNRFYLLRDGLHLNAYGYKVLKNYLKNHI